MYKYYQMDDKSSWIPIPLDKGVEDTVRDKGAKKLTVLAVSEVIQEDTDRASLSYKGPLYFDIDVKEDLSQALQSTKELVIKLRELGVDDAGMEVYASGSKGFHIIVPQKVFSSGRAIKNLPYIYKEMALSLYVLGLDFQVYSGGRGVSWRLANVKRDNGHYRVQLSMRQLFDMDAKNYSLYTEAPRPINLSETTQAPKADALAALFSSCKKKATTNLQSKQYTEVEQSALQQFNPEPPACIQMMTSGDIKKGLNFNQASMQSAIFFTRAGYSQSQMSSHLSKMAANTESSQYATDYSRLTHLKGVASYVGSNKKYKFSCGGVRSIVGRDGCDGCPLQTENYLDEDLSIDIGISERSDGYYVKGDKEDRRITTFILNPISIYIDRSQGGTTDRRSLCHMEVVRNSEILGNIMFEEDGWLSKAGFKGQIKGIGNLSYLGSDNDIDRIKHWLFREGQEMGEIIQTYTAGIHTQKVGNKEIMVYVEPGLSVNSLRVRGTHNLTGTVPVPPDLKSAKLPEKGEGKVSHALTALLDINSPAVVSQVLGWFCGAHLKAHLFRIYGSFPILSLHGNSGCGKSKTAGLMAMLNGCDYTYKDTPMNLANATEWALVDYCSSTTTIPRLLEEFNKSKMTARRYTMASEVIKAAWSNESAARGTLSASKSNGRGKTGAQVVNIPISGPLVICSEQTPDMPALRQRMVQVFLTKAGRAGKTKSFETAAYHREDLTNFAKALTISALQTSKEQVTKWMDENDKLIPAQLDEDRPRYSYRVLMTGLDFMAEVCEEMELKVPVKEVKESLVEFMIDSAVEISRTKSKSEVDTIMESIAVMASLTSDGSEQWVIAGIHYFSNGDDLYIDLPIVHAIYRKFARTSRDKVVIETMSEFHKLICQETYFISDKATLPEAPNKVMIKLSLQKLIDKGIYVQPLR